MKSRIKINKSHIAELLSELLGTMILFIVIFALALILRTTDPLLIGLFYIALLYAFSGYSKAYFNPIYSFADFLYSIYKSIRLKNKNIVIKGAIKFVAYFVVQLLGAVLAYVIISSLSGQVGDFYMVKYGGAETIKDQIVTGTQYGSVLTNDAGTLAFLLEMLFGAMLVWFSDVSSKRHEKSFIVRPVILGFAICTFMFVVKDVSGSTFNMLHNLVATIFEKETYIDALWVYTLAPLAGAAIAVIIKIIFSVLKDDGYSVEKKEVVKKGMDKKMPMKKEMRGSSFKKGGKRR